jgi:hypothetical protein
LGDELERPETAATIAAAFLPDKEYEKAFFTDGPRRILAHLLKKKPQPRDILKWMADPDQMARMVKGTPLAALIDSAAPAQRAGVLSSLNMVADSLELLPEWNEADGKTFSTDEWYTERKRWVFLTSSPAYREKILPLHSVWLDLFILRMMGYCEDPKVKPVWFVIDELASLNKLPQLHTALTENRKYGNPVVLGFQGRSQMEKRYGQDAEAMLSQPATKVFLKTSEPRAAKWVSEAIGEIEVERLKESRSMGLLRSKKSFALEIATKPLVMASEISGLEPLCGFIKQENRVVPVRFALAKKRDETASIHRAEEARSRAQAGRASAGNAGTRRPPLRHRRKREPRRPRPRPRRRFRQRPPRSPRKHTSGMRQRESTKRLCYLSRNHSRQARRGRTTRGSLLRVSKITGAATSRDIASGRAGLPESGALREPSARSTSPA